MHTITNDTQKTKSPARLHAILARRGPNAVVFRRGPSDKVARCRGEVYVDYAERGGNEVVRLQRVAIGRSSSINTYAKPTILILNPQSLTFSFQLSVCM